MQYTSNYNLMLPEGTDTVNLLTQMNPNTSDIDAALFASKQAVVGRASELTAGTVHAITRSNTDSPVFAFTATSNWTSGDSMSVDGVACSVYLTDGTQPITGSYVINSEVLAIIQGSRVTIFANKALQSVSASDVSYDNTVSGLAATDAQNAIDEIAEPVTLLNQAVTDTATPYTLEDDYTKYKSILIQCNDLTYIRGGQLLDTASFTLIGNASILYRGGGNMYDLIVRRSGDNILTINCDPNLVVTVKIIGYK